MSWNVVHWNFANLTILMFKSFRYQSLNFFLYTEPLGNNPNKHFSTRASAIPQPCQERINTPRDRARNKEQPKGMMVTLFLRYKFLPRVTHVLRHCRQDNDDTLKEPFSPDLSIYLFLSRDSKWWLNYWKSIFFSFFCFFIFFFIFYSRYIHFFLLILSFNMIIIWNYISF